MSQSAYAVLYFDIRGRAEPVRLVLTLAGQAFEDRAVVRERWLETKAALPLGQAPVLYERTPEGERAIPQSQAILRHLGRKFGLYGANEEEMLLCDLVAETVYDVRHPLTPVTQPGTRGKDPAALRAAVDTGLPPQLARLEKAHGWSKAPEAGFFVTSTPTWADALAYDQLDHLEAIAPAILAPYPGLNRFLAAMRAWPALAEYRKVQRKSELAPLGRVYATGEPL